MPPARRSSRTGGTGSGSRSRVPPRANLPSVARRTGLPWSGSGGPTAPAALLWHPFREAPGWSRRVSRRLHARVVWQVGESSKGKATQRRRHGTGNRDRAGESGVSVGERLGAGRTIPVREGRFPLQLGNAVNSSLHGDLALSATFFAGRSGNRSTALVTVVTHRNRHEVQFRLMKWERDWAAPTPPTGRVAAEER